MTDRITVDQWSILLVLVGVTCLVPIWTFKYLPSVDLPNHILAAKLLAGEMDTASNQYLTAHWLPSPYVLFYVLMFPFIKIFGAIAASKIVLSLYAVLIPVSVFLFIREFNPGNEILAVFAVPFVFNYHFEYGFIPYCMGIPFVFLGWYAIGRAIRTGFSWRMVVLSAAIASCVYLSHFVNSMAFCAGVVVLLLVRRNRISGQYLTVAGKLILVALPSVLLFALYLSMTAGVFTKSTNAMSLGAYLGWRRQLVGAFRFMFSTVRWVDMAAIVLLFAIAGWAWMRERRRQYGFPVAVGIVMLVMSVVVPRGFFFACYELSSRFAIFGWLAMFSALKVDRATTRYGALIGVGVISLGLTAARMDLYSELNARTQDYVQAVESNIPPGSRVSTVATEYVEANVSYLLHAIGYYHLERGGYSPFLFTDQGHVAGVESSYNPPSLSEEWQDSSLARLPIVLPNYDYLVVTTYDMPISQKLLEALGEALVYSDRSLTIFDVKKSRLSGEKGAVVR